FVQMSFITTNKRLEVNSHSPADLFVCCLVLICCSRFVVAPAITCGDQRGISNFSRPRRGPPPKFCARRPRNRCSQITCYFDGYGSIAPATKIQLQGPCSSSK